MAGGLGCGLWDVGEGHDQVASLVLRLVSQFKPN